MGQKPLVYRHDGGRLSFASELKALLALPEADVPRRSTRWRSTSTFAYGYVPHPRTILEGTSKLPPAHYAVWHDGHAGDRALLEPRLEHRARSARRGGRRGAARDPAAMPCASR